MISSPLVWAVRLLRGWRRIATGCNGSPKIL
ncbi:hypothetical protein C8J31_102886 [Rhizobium sp. PP-CC-2G-626]|nr:hypothetical protein C8J31_102886 [Rhizobium sp. PP-CC-2G-626]